MFLAISSFKPAIDHILKDRINLLLALIPVTIGILLYYFFGTWFYHSVIEFGQQKINSSIANETMGSVLYYIASIILTILLYFVTSYTFVLVVSVLSSPFNDILSSRIEKKIQGKIQVSMGESIEGMFRNIWFTLFNELKKIVFIIGLSCFAFLFSYIPVLTPIGILCTAWLLSVEFLDFSWGRHKMSFADCFKDIKSSWFVYGISGGIIMLLISIPMINLLVPSLATSYFTTIWVKTNESRN